MTDQPKGQQTDMRVHREVVPASIKLSTVLLFTIHFAFAVISDTSSGSSLGTTMSCCWSVGWYVGQSVCHYVLIEREVTLAAKELIDEGLEKVRRDQGERVNAPWSVQRSLRAINKGRLNNRLLPGIVKHTKFAMKLQLIFNQIKPRRLDQLN